MLNPRISLLFFPKFERQSRWPVDASKKIVPLPFFWISALDLLRTMWQPLTEVVVQKPRCEKAGQRLFLIAALVMAGTCTSLDSMAQDAGKSVSSTKGTHFSLGNDVIEASWTVDGRAFTGLVMTDKLNHIKLALPEAFALLMKGGAIYTPADLDVIGKPQFEVLTATESASRYSDRLPGEQCSVALADKTGDLHVTWTIVLRDGSQYVREFLKIDAANHDAPLARVRLIDLQSPSAQVIGSVKGSPIVAGDMFLGFEHPLSDSKVTDGRAVATIDRDLPLKAGQSVTYSSVVGVTHASQLRRDFLTYIERERAHPYRTFLHYNSWYDIGYFTPYGQEDALNRINTFGNELHEKRGVKLDSFLFDDGWDNHTSLWNFNKGFPEGFTPIRKAASRYNSEPGVWMSPWGGYEEPKKERIEFGKKAGFEVVDGGFALSGPKYYARFREVCLQMIERYGINQFKFDGTGNANSVFPGSQFDSDFSAAISLIRDLREAKPDIFINLTTGTYPSPFWLLYADSIWRGGEDDSVAGVGPYRERWITYRDADTYEEVVKAGPLYPLNSIMLHGIIYAQHHRQLSKDPDNDFRNEVRDYFGTGTQLQEMYITPSLLSSENWDDLAEAAKWSRANAQVLKDTHWVGGDPAWLEVYGWASWSPEKAILVLRNPSDKPQSVSLDIQKALQIPAGSPLKFTAHSPWKSDVDTVPIELQGNVLHEFKLAPFQVLTLDMVALR